MDAIIGEKNPAAPHPPEGKTSQVGTTFFGEQRSVFKISESKDELYAYISKTSEQEVQSLLTRKVVPQQMVDAEFLNRLAKGNELVPLKMFLAYAKESLLYIGLLPILKNASVDSALLVIEQLKTVPPRAPFEIFKNFAHDPEGCLKIVTLLVDKGWDPKSATPHGETLRDLAIQQGYPAESPFCQALSKLGVK